MSLEFAYAAGVIDSDGSIFLYGGKRDTGHSKIVYYTENVSIGQVDPQAIELMERLFGGSTHKQERTQTNLFKGQCKPILHWRVTGKKAVACLEAILPFLRIKRQQAELALKFHKERKASFARRVGHARTEKDRAILEGIIDEVRALNHGKGDKRRLADRARRENSHDLHAPTEHV